MNYVSKENMADILDGIARKIGQGGGSGAGLEDWQASHEYAENDICVYEGQIYRAKVGFTSNTTFSTTQILEEYTPVGGETIIPYEKDTEINIDDIVSYDNNTYKALYNFVCGEEFSLYALQEYVPQELTTEDIKQIIDAYNPVFEEAKGIEYSTEERRIGTWIDGKPLYQITIQDTMPVVTTDGTRATKNIDISNLRIDKCICIEAFIFRYENGGYRDCIPFDSINNTSLFSHLEVNRIDYSHDYSDNLFCACSRTTDNNRPFYATLKYTKTTD